MSLTKNRVQHGGRYARYHSNRCERAGQRRRWFGAVCSSRSKHWRGNCIKRFNKCWRIITLWVAPSWVRSQWTCWTSANTNADANAGGLQVSTGGACVNLRQKDVVRYEFTAARVLQDGVPGGLDRIPAQLCCMRGPSITRRKLSIRSIRGELRPYCEGAERVGV
jgi:hypothetical protein